MKTGIKSSLTGVAYHLMTIANLIARSTAQNTLKGSGLNLNQWRLLRFFAASPDATATDVIGALGIDKTTVSRAITDLRSGNLIKLAPNPSDRRQTLISLTALGRRVHDRIYPVDQRLDDSFESALSASEARVLEPILVKLQAHARTLADIVA